LISVISAARPKIANYPFTTSSLISASSMPMAALAGTAPSLAALLSSPISPASSEGAHEGAGLGIRFLRHVERTRLLVHLIDTSDSNDNDPIHSFEVINGELAAFSEIPHRKTHDRGFATKLDAITDRARLEALQISVRNAALNSTHLRRPRAMA